MGAGESRTFKSGYLYTIKYQHVTFGEVRTARVVYVRKQNSGSHYFKKGSFHPGDNDRIEIMNNNQPIEEKRKDLYDYYFKYCRLERTSCDANFESKDLVLWDSEITDVYEGLKQVSVEKKALRF